MITRHPLLRAAYVAMPQLKKPASGVATLPALPFDLKAGIPGVFSPEQVALHYSKHHAAYVDKLNALAGGSEFADMPIESIARHALRKEQGVLFNQAGQHFNHSFYWACMRSDMCTKPVADVLPGELKEQLIRDFGSVDGFVKAFEDSGVANFGSGWTWLVWNSSKKAFSITNTGNAAAPHLSHQEEGPSRTCCPVLTVDVWEHAYYKDYENRRAEYLKKFWTIVNWDAVAQNWNRARQ